MQFPAIVKSTFDVAQWGLFTDKSGFKQKYKFVGLRSNVSAVLSLIEMEIYNN